VLLFHSPLGSLRSFLSLRFPLESPSPSGRDIRGTSDHISKDNASASPDIGRGQWLIRIRHKESPGKCSDKQSGIFPSGSTSDVSLSRLSVHFKDASRASGAHINHEDLFDAALSLSFGLSTPYANVGDIARQRVILFLPRAVKA